MSSNAVSYADDQTLVFDCPHCQGTVFVLKHEVNCQIFRHATFKSTGEPVHPHATQEELNMLLLTDQVYGCGGPFRLIQKDNMWSFATTCDYI